MGNAKRVTTGVEPVLAVFKASPRLMRAVRELADREGIGWTTYLRKIATEHVAASTGQTFDLNDIRDP